MEDLQKVNNAEMTSQAMLTMANRLEIIEEGIRKKYLSRLETR